MTPLLGFFASVMSMRRLSVSWPFLYWLRRGYLDFGEVVLEHRALHVFLGLQRARGHDVEHFAHDFLRRLLADRRPLLLLLVRLLHARVQALDVVDDLFSGAYLVVGLAQLHGDVDLEGLQVLAVVRVQAALLALAAGLCGDGVHEALEVGVAFGGGVHAVDVVAVEGRVEDEDGDVRDGAEVDEVVDGGGQEARGESAEDC